MESIKSNQDEYDQLVKNIFNLSESERLRFYELHHIVPIPKNNTAYALIQEFRIQKAFNDRFILSKEERKFIFDILEMKRISIGLNRFEYNYLNFISWLHNYPLSAELPCFPDVNKISFEKFREEFATNAHREKLYTILLNGILLSSQVYGLEKINIIVGGSYVDLKNANPGDVDLILLLPRNIFRMDYKNEKLNKIILTFKDNDSSTKYFDLLKLPEDYDNNLYMAYEQITLLGNSPESKVEESITSIKFHCRHLYRINCTQTEILDLTRM